jgi:hypothetical protein
VINAPPFIGPFHGTSAVTSGSRVGVGDGTNVGVGEGGAVGEYVAMTHSPEGSRTRPSGTALGLAVGWYVTPKCSGGCVGGDVGWYVLPAKRGGLLGEKVGA